MPNLTQLRLAAREIFKETLSTLDAGGAVRNAISLESFRLKVCDVAIELDKDTTIYSIAIGKAAFPMAYGLEDVLAERFKGGLVIGIWENPPNTSRIEDRVRHKIDTRWRWITGSHPVPTNSSLFGAETSFELLERANAEAGALLIFLVSGGGSAMIEYPITTEITLSDLRRANKVLVTSGASIIEINAVRRAFSSVKGGRLGARASNCDQITLIVSDVPAGEEANVASGPTLPPPENAPDAREVVARYDLRSKLPQTVLKAIDEPPEEPVQTNSGLLRKHFVLLDNAVALAGAAQSARRRGFAATIATEINDQSIEQGCNQLLERFAQEAGGESPACLLSGGEFACPVRGDGIGGRNLETALRIAIANTTEDAKPWVALCVGTDGIDGNSPAAGAIVDNTTRQRARAIGLEAEDFLNRSDAYSFFVALGDVIATGPTGTNVRDVRILLK